MSKTNILTKKQLLLLKLLAKEEKLTAVFYLSGGTALTEFYIPYRLSEDLDFFSLNEVDQQTIQAISVFFKKNKNTLGYESMEFNTSFNRNLFFLNFPDQILKTEFTYYPFTQIENPIDKNGILVDSLIDIATNKLFTIYQQPRSRDFMDLYQICDLKKYSIKDLTQKARIKFDTYIDPIKLGAQFMLCQKVKDYPNLLVDLPDKNWQGFFITQAKILEKDILK